MASLRSFNRILGRYIPAGSVKIEAKNAPAVFYAKDLHVVAYVGKATRPTWNYLFKSREIMEKTIAQTIESAAATQRRRLERRQSLKEPRNIAVGDIFYTSWGYDQTNVDWLRVVALVGESSAIVETIPGNQTESTSHDSAREMPDLNSPGSHPVKVLVRGQRFKWNGYYASKWDGKSKHVSWGH